MEERLPVTDGVLAFLPLSITKLPLLTGVLLSECAVPLPLEWVETTTATPFQELILLSQDAAAPKETTATCLTLSKIMLPP